MTTKVNTPNLNATFLGSLVKVNDTQTVNNKTFNSPTLITPALGTPTSGDFSTGTFTWPLFYQDTKANAAFVAANSAGTYANAAFSYANTIGSSTSFQASAAFDAANTADQKAVSAGSYANSAFSQANTGVTNAATADSKAVISGVFANGAYLAANTADQKAVSAGVYANAAYNQANTANTNAATADQRAVTSGVYANMSFGVANSASSYANGAFVSSNTAATNALSAGSYANSAYALANTKYSSSGGAISGDVTITGNLTITGTTTTVSANNLSIQDNMIYLNANNSVTNPDLGIAGNYNDGVYHHTGVFRDATDGTWKFYYNYSPEPDASPYIDTAHATFRIANLTANLITDVATIRGYDPINHTNSAFTQANTANTNAATADQRAVTSGVYANAAYSVANTATTSAAQADQRAVTSGSFANSAYAAANTADQRAVTSGSYANSAYTQANTAVTNAGSASSYANSAFTVANAAVSLTGTQTLTNKSLSDNTTYFVDESDGTKKLQFQVSTISSGATRILSVPNYDGVIATLYGTETLTSKTLSSPAINLPTIASPIETVSINASAPTATVNHYVQSGAVLYYTSNATNNFTWNVAAANDVTLNTWLSIGRAVTIVVLVTNGTTAYYPSAITIDGTSVTPKYVGGSAISAGNANAIDSYTMTIIKTASATYTVLLSQTKLA